MNEVLQSLREISKQNQYKNKQNYFSQLKQNMEIILNLIKNACKTDKDFSLQLVNFYKQHDRLTLKQSHRAIFEYLAFFLTCFENNNGLLGINYLTVAPTGYLPEPAAKNKPYTLVLDLDETLIHYQLINGGGQFMVRPFAQQFLEELSPYYEIVVFTAAMPDYANWVLDNFDKKKLIDHRLFRYHAVRIGNLFIKDLSRIGRDLSRVIIIDNVAENF